MYDLLFKNGRVFDGTGGAADSADVAAVGGDIVAIGSLEGEAGKTIDVGGMAVCPGFIDLHTHSDMSFLLDPTAQSKVRQGVTLELVGNRGMSFCAPVEGAAGVSHVTVNGELVVESGGFTGLTPGKVIRDFGD